MTTPFREHQFRAKTGEFLENFGKEYISSVGWEVLEDVQNIATHESKNNDQRQLQYRDWQSVPRTDLFEGFCCIKTGFGPGSFTKWRCVYLVEKQDYNIEIYRDKHEFEASKLTDMIEMSGYTLNTNPTDHYRAESVWLAGALELTVRDVEALSTFSEVSWALTHPWRKNYIFQLHTNQQPSCWCWSANTVEPSETEEDADTERALYISMMENCLTKASAEEDSIQSRAFQRTVGALSNKYNRPGYSNSGHSEQILTDMVMEFCFKPMRHDILREISGPDSLRLSLWYKIQDTAYGLAYKIVREVWGKTLEASKQAEAKVRGVITERLDEVKTAREKLTQALLDKVEGAIKKIMELAVHPVIKPIMRVMEEPIQRIFDDPKQTFLRKVPEVTKLPTEMEERNGTLDRIPRDQYVTSDVTSKAYDVIDSISQISKICEVPVEEANHVKRKEELVNTVLQVLDGAVNSLELRLQDDNIGQKDQCKADVLQCMEHDLCLAKRDFVARVIVGLLFKKVDILLKNKLEEDWMEDIKEDMPSEFKEFLIIHNIYKSIVTNVVREPIETVIGHLYQDKSQQ